jgi:hypothetical protein
VPYDLEPRQNFRLTKTHPETSLTLLGTCMSLVPLARKCCPGLSAARMMIICVITLILFGRGTILYLLSHEHGRVKHSLAHQCHSQCFDQDDSLWSSSPPITLSPPLLAAESNLASISEPYIETITRAWDCDRPPPLG